MYKETLEYNTTLDFEDDKTMEIYIDRSTIQLTDVDNKNSIYMSHNDFAVLLSLVDRFQRIEKQCEFKS